MSAPSRRTTLVMIGLLPWVPAARSQAEPAEPPLRIEGRAIARRVQVAGTELRLNGAGVRAVAWFKAFVAALYLGQRAGSAAEAISAPGPKRLQMHMLAEVPAAELSKALRRGVMRNLPAAERDPLAVPVEVLAARIDAIGTLRKGDVLDLDWDPTRGVVLSLNGTLRGVERDPGREPPALSHPALYPAVLRAFIGGRPYDERLKAGLLAVPAPPPPKQTTPGD
jgi:hypothetical protein